MTKVLTCCPKCSGVSGFSYTMYVEHHMLGIWGSDAECGDSGKTTVSLAKCMDCGSKVRVSTAESQKQLPGEPA